MSALQPLVSHVLEAISRKGGPRPLFVALQGPQGSGKSYLSALLVAELRTRSLNTALLSLDDIYLPHAELVTLAELHPDNPLWRGRGQPGTHDVPLGLHVLSQLEEGKPVEIPRFDKSLYNGEGDRLPAGFAGGVVVDPPVDVVIFEGWCVGFYPVSIEKLDALWNGAWVDQSQQLGLGDSVQKQNVSDVNDTLKDYIPLWNFFDTFVQLQPTPSAEESPLSVVYLWRLEQEHNMKARNGGKGMSDESVKAFVDRYIPGYVFFGGGPAVGFGSEAPRWLGNSLRVHIDDKRMVVATETF